MRKIGAIGFIAVLLFVLMGCSGEKTSPSEATQSKSSIETNGGNTAAQTPDVEQTKTSSAVASPSPEQSKPAAKEPGAEETKETSQAPSPSTSPKATPKQPDIATPAVDSITLSIEGNAKWGTVLAAESVIIAKGDTASGVLKRTAKAHRLSYDIRGSGALTYVSGIDGLYEFDDGPTSGWKYRVNNIVPDIGAGAYKLKPGDKLEWFYTSEDDAAKEDKEPAS
ncbi:DUF4430 domain-containing protein [Cohnella silvisoli]|uniref:DUF4430 domain-containing protein n=1 Tax=Cohnella silvisoli TaxID=2873699 RepID=A0ABV1KSJ7_9BACL|nr:DUF4430 domain-containing protein [Cohnella silvisoli]MCD9022659.1 DUF4430 domain-containing protein [Cohnella silvisoli]